MVWPTAFFLAGKLFLVITVVRLSQREVNAHGFATFAHKRKARADKTSFRIPRYTAQILATIVFSVPFPILNSLLWI